MARTPSARYLLPLLALALTAGMLPAPVAKAAATKVQALEGITEYRLDNGLQVLLYPDASKPTVTVNLTVFVGSRHEGYGETGMAHLLEHMVFKGTPNHPHIPKALQERGANFNGTTWVDRTNYYETLPASEDNLNFALELESDRLVNSFIKQEDLFSEMTVVRNEFEAGENSPSNLLNQRILSAAYDWHNYGKSTIGNRSDIERVPIKNLQAFYKKYYQPDNCMLVIAGKFDPATAMQLVEKHFGALPKPERTLDKTYTEEPAQDGERSVTLRRVGDLGIVAAAYHIPSGGHEDVAALDILANILGSAPSGRLYKALVETKKASGVGTSAANWHDPGVFEIEAEVRKGDSLDEVRDILLDVVENAKTTPFTKTEVDRARQRLLKQRELAAADTSHIAIQLSDWAAQGDWRLYLLHRDRLEKVTPEQVQQAAKKYLRRENRTLGMFIPSETSEKAEIPAPPDLAATFKGYEGRGEGALGEAFDPTPQNIDARSQQVTIGGGIKGVLLPKKTRGEAVYVRLVLRYGDLESLSGRVAATEMLPAMMVRGTKKLTRQQLQDELDKNNATLSSFGTPGLASFTIRTKREHLPAVLELLKQVLREPTLPADEFDILRRQQLAALDEQLTNPAMLAITRVRRLVSPYPKDDVRYVPTIEEEIERFKTVSTDDVRKLYEQFLGSQAGELAIVGDFDVDENLKVLQGALADWTSQKPYARIPTEYFPNVAGTTERIETPDKANAIYVAGEAFPLKESDPQYAAMVIGNYIFGGGSLSSRLGDRVRQKEGLSYGVGSSLSSNALDARSSLTISAICNPQVIDKVNAAIGEELAKLLADGVTASELAQAKQGYLQQEQVARTDDPTLASILTENLHVGRTMAFYADLEKRIGALEPEQVLEALRKYVDPKKLVIIDAGDFAKKPDAAEAKPAEKSGG